MVPPILFALCAGLLSLTDAFIEFDKSRLYDEKDFEGHVTVHLHDYCSIGCQIYVSVAADANETAKHIYIEDRRGRKTSLLNANTQEKDGRKNPYIVEKGNTHMRLLNENDDAKSAPVAVWVVRKDADHIATAQVYAVTGYDPGHVGSGGINTYLSVEPFTVFIGGRGKISSSEAITAGFDAFGSDCARVVKESQQDIIHIGKIRSPLFSVKFELAPESDIPISSKLWNYYEKSIKSDLRKPASYASSTGYIGCAVKEGPGRTKTFRSSLYEKETTTYHFSTYDTNSTQILIYSDIGVNKNHPVEIVADGQSIKWSGIDGSPSKRLDVQNMTITWNRNDDYADEYFMIRVTKGAANGISMLLSVILLVLMCH